MRAKLGEEVGREGDAKCQHDGADAGLESDDAGEREEDAWQGADQIDERKEDKLRRSAKRHGEQGGDGPYAQGHERRAGAVEKAEAGADNQAGVDVLSRIVSAEEMAVPRRHIDIGTEHQRVLGDQPVTGDSHHKGDRHDEIGEHGHQAQA